MKVTPDGSFSFRDYLRRLTSLRALFRTYRQIDSVRMLYLGIVVGILSGGAACLFYLCIELLKPFLLGVVAGVVIPEPAGEGIFHFGHGAYRPWVIPLLITAVGLFTGWLVQRYVPEALQGGTDGTDSMIRTFHHKRGRVRFVIPFIRSSTAILTISSGGSAGQEGPISQLCSGIGSWLAVRWKLTVRERRILLLAGAAGGLGAIFRAPLGGALTAIEVLYREDFESEAILPAVISSVVAYSIFTLFFGATPLLGIPDFSFRVQELPFYLVLSVVCAATGWLYVRSFSAIKYRVFSPVREKIGIMWTCGLGGLAMGLLGMFFPYVLSGGYGYLELAILGQLPIMLMFTIVLAKTVATSITLGSGMSGGMFAPALFVGGMAGGLVGKLAERFFPDMVAQPGAYVLVGMAAFFAGIAHAPIGPLVMVCEISQGYGLLAPLMLASAVCLVVNRNVYLYEHQVENKFDSPAHIADSTVNILEQLQVRDFFKESAPTVLDEDTTLKQLTGIISRTNELNFPVMNGEHELVGILSVQDVRKVLYENCLYDLVVARDVARRPTSLMPSDDLYTALVAFVDSDLSQIPVVHPDDAHHILGLINREDVFTAYSTTICEIKDQK